MRLILIGPPGSGKGTQGILLSERLHLTHLGMGDILRSAIKANSPVGLQAAPFINVGKLAPDSLVNSLVQERFSGQDCPERFVMDGYPRTHNQADFFDGMLSGKKLPLTAVLEFQVEDDAIVQRLSGRRVCTNSDCSTNYHVTFRPPKVTNVCDRCGSELMQRVDDDENTIRDRLQIYHDNSKPLLEHYRTLGLLQVVQAKNDPESIYNEIMSLLSPAG